MFDADTINACMYISSYVYIMCVVYGTWPIGITI